MSREQLTRPTPVVGGLNMAGITSGIMTVYNNAIAALNISDNLDLDGTNTLNIVDNPTFGIIQDSNLTQTGTNNVGLGTGALDSITNNSGANVAVGSYALSSLTIGGGNTALGYLAGSNLQNSPTLNTALGNTFIGTLAGVYGWQINPEAIPLNYGTLGTYIGSFSSPSSDDAINEAVIGTYRQGLGSGTTTIGNGQFDLGTLTTNPGLERFTFNASYTPNTTYEPVHIASTYGLGNVHLSAHTFYVDQPGIYRFTLQVTQQSQAQHVWGVYQTTNPGVNVTGTVVSLTSPEHHLATDLYFISDSLQKFYVMSNHGNGAAVTVEINLSVEFVSLYAD
jgi:hypothetical protein